MLREALDPRQRSKRAAIEDPCFAMRGNFLTEAKKYNLILKNFGLLLIFYGLATSFTFS